MVRKKRVTKADQKRERLREELWPGSADRIWTGPKEKGYWCAPRVLPLLLHLTKDKAIVGGVDCSSVYVELLSRDYGQGLVEILDEDEHAYCAGYPSSRARRTWRERMRLLEEAGFIEVKPKGNRALGYVLVLHPAHVVSALRRAGKIDSRWWTLFQQQMLDTTGRMLEDSSKPGGLRVIPGGAEETEHGPVGAEQRRAKR